MKNLFLLTSIICFNLQAQLNTSFENWNSTFGYSEPNSWYTMNFFSLGGGNLSCIQSSKAHWGNSSALVTTCFIPGQDTFNGTLFQAVPISSRPKSVSVYYQYSGSLSDSASFIVQFFKGSINPGNSIGMALSFFKPNATWTKLSLDIDWTSSDLPDSMMILFTSSLSSMNDTLAVDDLEFSSFNLGISHTGMHESPIYYAPGLKSLIWKNTDEIISPVKINVSGMDGRNLISVMNNGESIKLGMLPPGVYYYELIEGESRIFRKFIID